MSLVILDQLVRAYNLWSFSMKWQVSRSKEDDKNLPAPGFSPSCPTTRASHALRSSTCDRARPRGCKIVKYRRTTCGNCGDIDKSAVCAKIAGRLAQLRRLSTTYNWRLNVAIRIHTIFRAHVSHALNRARKVGEFKLPHNGKGIIPFAGIL